MALWGKTDADISKPKYLTTADKAKAVFVSAEEAVLGTNKSKGITGAGWWLLNEYIGSNGETRYKTEHLIAMTVANATSGDAADDAKVSDVEVVITITSQPGIGDPLTFNTNPLTLSANATVNVGSLTYQWQKKANTTGARWANVSGATSNTLELTGLSATNVGEEYRYILGSDSGAKKVTSNPFVLTTFSEE